MGKIFPCKITEMSRSGEDISTPAYPTPPNFQTAGEHTITVSVI